MHCEMCGVALGLNRAEGMDLCVRCFEIQESRELSQPSIDGTERTGEEIGGVNCPRCAVTLEIGFLDGIKIATCPECDGNLVGLGDFAHIVHDRRVHGQSEGDPPRPLNPTELRVQARCPSCLGPMETYPYAGPGAVVIDSCESCQLIWIDRGELRRIEHAPGLRR